MAPAHRVAPLTPLGVALFPALGLQNRLPVGGTLVFFNDALNTFLTASLNAGKTSITIVASVVHDGKVPVNDWRNFNYLFNPKGLPDAHGRRRLRLRHHESQQSARQPVVIRQQRRGRQRLPSPFSPQLIFGPSGDFNLDDTVNAADYVVWRKNHNSPTRYNQWQPTSACQPAPPAMPPPSPSPRPSSSPPSPPPSH